MTVFREMLYLEFLGFPFYIPMTFMKDLFYIYMKRNQHQGVKHIAGGTNVELQKNHKIQFQRICK